MNLCSKSKGQIVRYVRLLRKNLKREQEIVDCLEDCLHQTQEELRRSRNFWRGEIHKVGEIHRLKTAHLEKHNKALTDMMVRGEMLRTYPPIILKTNEPELKALRKQVTELKAEMRNAAESLVKFL